MARTITEIKDSMTSYFMTMDAVRTAYNITGTQTFEQRFSAVSIESILFYAVAAAIYTVEKLFDIHQKEVMDTLETTMPHTNGWYTQRALGFQYNEDNPRIVDEHTGEYDNTGLEPDDIVALQIVKFAAAQDSGDGKVIIKVAAGEPGSRAPLTAEQLNAFEAYIKDVTDAGVRIDVRSSEGEPVVISANVWYNPTVLVPSGKSVEMAIKEHINTINFNSVLKRNTIEDVMQAVPGVEVVEIVACTVNGTTIGKQRVSESGWFAIGDDNITINYYEYNKNENL